MDNFFEVLEEGLQKCEKGKHKKVLIEAELDEEKLFEKAEVKILLKRSDGLKKRYQILNEDHRFENFTEGVQSYKFVTNKETRSSFSLSTTRGHTFTLQGKLSLSDPTGAATGEVGATYGYSRTKTRQNESSSGEIKTSEVCGDVQAEHVVTVKELTYRIEQKKSVDIQLKFSMFSKVPYTLEGKSDTITMSKVIEKINPAVKKECTEESELGQDKEKIKIFEDRVYVDMKVSITEESFENHLQINNAKLSQKRIEDYQLKRDIFNSEK